MRKRPARPSTQLTALLGSALAVAAALALVTATPATASQARRDGAEQTTYKVVPYVISDPTLVAHPARLVRELRRHGDLDRFGVKPATSHGPSPITKAHTDATADAQPVTYVTDSSRFPGGAKPDDIYDYANLQECDDNAWRASDDAGWIKNRYSYCQVHMLLMPAWECGIFPPRCRLTGVFESRNTLIGYGKSGGWKFQGLPYSRYADFFLDMDVKRSTGVFNRPGTTMTATMECDGEYKEEIDGLGDYACAGYPEEGVTRPAKRWRQDDTAEFSLSSEGLPPSPALGEQIATGVFHIEYDFDIPWYIQFIDTESPEGGMRFDSAWYITEAPLGSVFDRAVPGFSYSRSDPAVAGVADHVDDARTDPASTLPKRDGKVLHGATATDPIHRLAPGKSAATQTRYDLNRSTVKAFCRTKQMRATKPSTGGPYDCDEYAFASTYEGAARWRYDGKQYRRMYSVRWVDSEVNQEAGRRLGRWYTNDRILDGEDFFVPIVP